MNKINLMKKIKYLKITDNKLNLLLYIQILVDQSSLITNKDLNDHIKYNLAYKTYI